VSGDSGAVRIGSGFSMTSGGSGVVVVSSGTTYSGR
jgi:hypothetical protein